MIVAFFFLLEVSERSPPYFSFPAAHDRRIEQSPKESGQGCVTSKTIMRMLKQSSSQNPQSAKTKQSASKLSLLLSLLKVYDIANSVDLMKFTKKF